MHGVSAAAASVVAVIASDSAVGLLPIPRCCLILFRPTTLHLSHADRVLRTKNSLPIVAGRARRTGLLRLRGGVARWLRVHVLVLVHVGLLRSLVLAPAGEAATAVLEASQTPPCDDDGGAGDWTE